MARKKNDTAEDVAEEKVDVVSAKEQVETSESITQNTNESTKLFDGNDQNDVLGDDFDFETPDVASPSPRTDLHTKEARWNGNDASRQDSPERVKSNYNPNPVGSSGDLFETTMLYASNRTTLRIKRLDHAGAQPDIKYQTANAAGLDLYAAIPEEMKIKPGGRVQVPTGLAVEIPDGFEGQVRPRSSLAWKDGIMVVNSPGTVDADYRGEIKILLLNTSNNTFRVQPGDRIAQIVIAPVVQVSIEYVDELSTTVRGTGGFGSTGK